MKYLVAGFSNCGTHSLVEYLKRQGHDTSHWDTLYGRPLDFIKKQADRYDRVIFITRENSSYRIDFTYHLDRLSGVIPCRMVVSLEEMIKNPNFPHLNRTNEV